MGLLRICSLSVWLSTILFTHTLAQYIAPSNNSSDLYPIATSPRFLLKNSVNPEFGSLPVIRLAPLKPYAQDITKGDFLSVDQDGQLVNIDASNVNELQPNQFGYLSCDPGAYSGYLNASGVFDIAFNSGSAFIIILYSETHNHCSLNGVTDPSLVNAVLTTVDPSVASMLANLHLNSNSKGNCAILPDLNSYTNGSSSSGWDGSSILGPSPTTAVAMIILYSITGIITALFVVIIVTGAIRAHRHPERYGPRNFTGRGRQSRAKGIARAMLETLPIVKFGDHTDLPNKPAEGADVEMNAADASRDATSATKADGSEAAGAATRDKDGASTSDSEKAAAGAAHLQNADGTQADGSLACSICTEEFTKGEEVRVLPCNHKFHPECVDPWLLNVSGTCPLCRIDLRPKDEAAKEAEGTAEAEAATGVDGEGGADAAVLPPPLEGTAGPSAASGVRRDTITNLRGFATGTGEERIAALRRLREERRRRGLSNAEGEVERRSVRDRLTTRFRIRTLRGGATDETLGTGSTS